MFKTSAVVMAPFYTAPLTKGHCNFTSISSVAELRTGCRWFCVQHAFEKGFTGTHLI